MDSNAMASEPFPISARKANHFLGVARIDLDQLAFDVVSPNGHRNVSERIQTKLINVFKLEGCRRMEPENFIDALITRDTLSAALGSHQMSVQSFQDSYTSSNGSLRDVLRLRLPEPLQCLSGLHRVAAARCCLNKNDRWWIVRLYEKDCFEAELTNHIQETFGHEQQYTDGTIFRNIRRYHKLGDEENEKKWWARLTPSKRRDLKQLSKDKGCIDAFDSLIDLPGLWPPIQLGTLHRQHSLRCSEEMINYLQHVRDVWHAMVPQDTHQHLDECTVHELELLAPASSDSDESKVRDLFHRGQVFSAVTNQVKREGLLQSVLAQRCLIPTLRTFFENQKYLEPCSVILKSLLDDSEKRSLWKSFQANFFAPNAIQVQISEHSPSIEVLPLAGGKSTEAALKLGYMQLWMFCFRHFPEMTAFKPRLEMRTTQQTSQPQINAALLPKLASFAVKLGFRTDKAVALANEDPDLVAAEQFLRSMRPSSTVDISRQVVDIKRVLAEIDRASEVPFATQQSRFSANQSLSKERRCGRPFEQDHIRDHATLYVPLLYVEVESSTNFSSLYAKADTLKAFFRHCMSLEDSIVRALTSTWTQAAERNTTAHVVQERSTTNYISDVQQIRGETRQQNDKRLRYDAESTVLSNKLAQANVQIASLKEALSSAQQECSRCGDYDSLNSQLERLREHMLSKDLEIKELQDEVANLTVDDDVFSDHRNENVGIGYNELQQDYNRLQAIKNRLEEDKSELERKYTKLQNEYATYQSTTKHHEAEQRQQIDDMRQRITNQERLVTQRSRPGNSSMLERHRKVHFPFNGCADVQAEIAFQSDIEHIIRQFSGLEHSDDDFTVREISFDEEGLGFRSRLFRLQKVEDQVEEFLAWLCPREQYVFNRCTVHQGGHVDFQMIPSVNAGALMSASRPGTQIFYGLKECFSPNSFPLKYRCSATFGIAPGHKRPRAAVNIAESKRPALVDVRNDHVSSAEVSTYLSEEERTEQTNQGSVYEDTL